MFLFKGEIEEKEGGCVLLAQGRISWPEAVPLLAEDQYAAFLQSHVNAVQSTPQILGIEVTHWQTSLVHQTFVHKEGGEVIDVSSLLTAPSSEGALAVFDTAMLEVLDAVRSWLTA